MDKKKILVVDDEPDLVEMVRVRLEANGYLVRCAYDGNEGLEMIEQEPPDLILSDIRMAHMDGYTMLFQIKKREETRNIPVVILTAHDKMQDIFELEGVTDYIVKPFDEKDLLLRVARALR